jgi:mRNA-degrading endonuclease YafQ of YafQ-DinJ toxin-antitoxin module
MVAKKLELLMGNPFHPSLRTKKVQGFDGLFECSVNMNIRVLWKYEGSNIILMLDVAPHSILDKL